LGIFNVVVLFYLTVALVIGLTQDAPAGSGTPIGDAAGYGLSWPWLVIKYGPWPD
jgi:hypothetical protein